MLNSLLPDRPLEEQLAGTVTLELGGHRYVLPTLTRRQNRAWKERLTGELGGLFGSVQGSNDGGAIMAVLATAGDLVVELVRAYDVTGVIPPDDSPELERDTDQEWLRALLACGAAAYPFVGLALEAQRQAGVEPPSLPTPTGAEPTNGQQPSMAGAHGTSSTS